MKYGFIGLGNMATAIITGMVKSGKYAPESIFGFDVLKTQRDKLKYTLGITAMDSIAETVRNSDVVVLAVKPQVLPAVLGDVKKGIGNRLVVSIAAGKSIAYLEENLGASVPIVRVMPNINAKVGAATSCYTPNSHANDEHCRLVSALFETVGTVMELDEAHSGTFSAIAGAAPAFVYMFIDALARAGVRAGLPKATALDIAASMTFGSAKLIMESGEHPWALVDQVCSPGGTTIEGVCALQELGFESAVHAAVAAVIEKNNNL